jgi:photosystem II stability/assembly factor-like uncharacterized protein
MRRQHLWVAVALAALGSAGTLRAQRDAPGAPQIFGALTFRNIGPAQIGGRIDDLAVVESNPSVFYVATASAGLWKTVNNGTTWEALFDREPSVASVGAVALAQDAPDLVWVGTGESNNRQSSTWGNGVYKSTDGGRTWRSQGLTDTRHIARIVIDPRNHDIVYVAAVGHLFGANTERGVYKTSDGGTTWTQVLAVDADTGATDLVINTANPRILVAAMYQRRRAPWGFNGGGPGGGLYRSTDEGRTWTRITQGLPAGQVGRIGLDAYHADPNIIFALVEHTTEGGLYRSDDAGARWTKVSAMNPRPMYFSQIRVDPTDRQRIYVLGVGLEISNDGGRTFSSSYLLHTDHHAMWIDPKNPAHVIEGNDGGVGISYDRGASWVTVDNMNLGQFYHVGYDMDTPYRVYGGLQDNMAWGGPSATRHRLGVPGTEWFQIGEYDGFVATADPTDSRIVYAEAPTGRLLRIDRETNERKTIKPEGAPGEPPLRWNWNTPFLISPHAPNVILIGGNRVFRSADRGQTWNAISPDLTFNRDREQMALMGVAGKDIRYSKNDGVSSFSTLVALTESPKKAGVYYAGSDDGAVHVSRDGGQTWDNLSTAFPGLPGGTSVSGLAASRFDERVAYATFDGHLSDRYEPYVFVTRDAGRTWKAIAAGLPRDHTVRCITEDLKNPDVLYLGTEFGLFVSLDRGERWSRLANLPSVPVAEITLHPRDNDMLVATHGRGIWILDDLGPIQHATDAVGTEAYLFPVRPSIELRVAEDVSFWGQQRFLGQNPVRGAPLSYYVARKAQTIELLVRDSAGRVIRRIAGAGEQGAPRPGINRVNWDLRRAPHRAPLTPVTEVSSLFSGNGVDGPYVLPGVYRITLVVDGKEGPTESVTVKQDPAIQITNSDLTELSDTQMSLYQMHDAANDVGDVVRALTTESASLSRAAGPKGLSAEADALRQTIEALRPAGGRGQGGEGGPGSGLMAQLAATEFAVSASTTRPTTLQVQAAGRLRAQLDALIDRTNRVIEQEFSPLYRRVFGRDRPAEIAAVTPIAQRSR